jgi:hypothetical protein
VNIIGVIMASAHMKIEKENIVGRVLIWSVISVKIQNVFAMIPILSAMNVFHPVDTLKVIVAHRILPVR